MESGPNGLCAGPEGSQGLLQLFLEDQRLVGHSGTAVSKPQVSAAAPSQGSQGQALGWGGQPINDSNGYKVPWFGRRRGAATHRQRQCRTGSSSAEPVGIASEARAAQPSTPYKASAQVEEPMSVEEIVQLLKRTPRADPIPHRVFNSLHVLDSRAVALLLKDISKVGLDSRSIELFDWLRGLPERHQLRALCDVFTYTAMISLCIYQQNVERAMELLEEMRQRGVERNVHTYTALMNVCIKCGKLASALDIFTAMKGEGCTPNVVTYNTLIDVYGKLGQWDRAIGVLSMMRGEGVAPALRTFNTLIIACNMCNQPREALAVYQELRDSGFDANSTTYNALISAYGKLGQLERVLEVYKDMVWRGLERSVITYSSLISACEKAGRWETALQLFDEMQRDGCTPNTVTYNSLITACGQGAQWEKAGKVFEAMQAAGCQPDVVTFTALISAYERAGQWLLGLEAYDAMVSRGCWPDAIVYNAIIDALWQTGVLWAQTKARELFAVAVKQGHFRNERLSADGSRAELNLHALTAGVAMLSLQSFLQDLQSKVKESGEGSVPAHVAIVTDAGSASKEQGNFIIKDAASTSLAFWGSPFRAVQDRTYLGLLEASGPQLVSWVRSSSFAAMMASLFPPMPDPDALQQPGGVQQLELRAQKDCQSAFEAVRQFEASHNLVLQNMGASYLQQRAAMVGSILQKGGELGLPDEVIHDAVLLLDRAGSTGVQVTQEVLAVVAAAVLLIAMQQTGSSQVEAQSSSGLAAAFGVETQAVVRMVWQLRQVLQDDTIAISAMRCLKVYMERMGCGQMERQRLYLLAGLPMMLAVEAQFDTSLLNCRPSVVAAALLYAERRQRGAVPFWPSMLAKMTGYEDLTTPELACAVKAAQKLCRKAHYTQMYRAQSIQVAARLCGLTATAQQQQQQQLVLSSMPSPGGALALEAQASDQQAVVPPAAGMQADAVVAAPQVASRMPSASLAPSALSLQPSLSGQLSARTVSAGSSSSTALGVGMLGPIGNVGCMAAPGAAAGVGVRVGSLAEPCVVTPLPGPALQQSGLDLSMLAQLQRAQEQQQQQHQQQATSLAALSTGGIASANGLQLSPGSFAGVDLNTPMQAGLSLFPLAQQGAFLGPLNVTNAGGFAAAGMPSMGLGLPVQVVQARPQQEAADASGVESLALTLSALGLHSSDGRINAAALEAALRQQC